MAAGPSEKKCLCNRRGAFPAAIFFFPAQPAADALFLHMADKESTVFVVDIGSSMGGGEASLDQCLEYLWHVVAAKLVRARLTDYVLVVLYHLPITENALLDGATYQGIEVAANMEVPSYEMMNTLKKKLVVNDEPIGENDNLAFSALVVAMNLFKPTEGKKFIRNVVVITTHLVKTSEARALATSVEPLDVNLVVVGPTGDSSDTWNEVASHFKGVVLSAEQTHTVVRRRNPLKRTRPVAAYRGYLLFGRDVNVHDQGLNFSVELYPTAKREAFASAHTYSPDGQKVVRSTAHYIVRHNHRDDELEKPVHDESDDTAVDASERVPVSPEDWVSGFKYSNYDLIATPQHLLDMATLHSEPWIDIVGFLLKDKLPAAYSTSELFYVLPAASSGRDAQGVGALCKALYDLESVAIARYVKHKQKEFQMAALMPATIHISGAESLVFTLVRLPYKEDQKVGRFPKLSGKRDDGLVPPSEKAIELMEQFVKARSLGIENAVIHHPKLGLTKSASLPLPREFGHSAAAYLCADAPDLYKQHAYLKKVILGSLGQNLNEYLANEDLLRNVTDSSNLYSLQNILSINTETPDDWLVRPDAIAISDALVAELDIKYMEKAPKKKGPEKKDRGNYGANEGEYAEVPFDI